MPLPYQVYLHSTVFEFLRSCTRADRDKLLNLFEQLGSHPYRTGDYSEKDSSGQDIQVLIAGKYAVVFWADHAVSEVKVVAVRRAD